jgi:NADH:ubiquinone oxidoreductase subunit F (NADH-binding)
MSRAQALTNSVESDAVVGRPRLLGAGSAFGTSYAAHLQLHGSLPSTSRGELIDAVDLAGLTGRGGAAFPVARKLRAVAAGQGPVVVANASEGEPAAAKDKALLWASPHLVLDGLQLAAAMVGSSSAILYLHRDERLRSMMSDALENRRASGIDELPVRIVSAPARFVAGEESAVVSRIDGGPAQPRKKPPRVFESGVGGRPTLVQNVETLAHTALIARHGAAWFGGVGTGQEPGTMLFTVSGAVREPQVVEAGIGTPLRDLIAQAGGFVGRPQAILFGGYHGTWQPAAAAIDLAVCNEVLRPLGSSVGAGVIVVLPEGRCGVLEASRVIDYLAVESAGQCGPCLHGLPQVAKYFDDLAQPRRLARSQHRLEHYISMLDGRGACHHPDGSARFIRSAVSTFRAEFDLHRRGRCSATSTDPFLPTPDSARLGWH